jgi:hypothetical protein
MVINNIQYFYLSFEDIDVHRCGGVRLEGGNRGFLGLAVLPCQAMTKLTAKSAGWPRCALVVSPISTDSASQTLGKYSATSRLSPALASCLPSSSGPSLNLLMRSILYVRRHLYMQICCCITVLQQCRVTSSLQYAVPRILTAH